MFPGNEINLAHGEENPFAHGKETNITHEENPLPMANETHLVHDTVWAEAGRKGLEPHAKSASEDRA